MKNGSTRDLKLIVEDLIKEERHQKQTEYQAGRLSALETILRLINKGEEQCKTT